MGGDGRHLNGGYCQEEDQELHLGDIRLRNKQRSGISEEKEVRLKGQKIIRIKTQICWFQEMINIFKCHRSQIK